MPRVKNRPRTVAAIGLGAPRVKNRPPTACEAITLAIRLGAPRVKNRPSAVVSENMQQEMGYWRTNSFDPDSKTRQIICVLHSLPHALYGLSL